jgi:hypothetical protein
MNEQIERSELLSLYSDVFKDANGFRPRGILWPDSLTNEEIQAKLEDLHDSVRRQIEDDLLEEERYQEEQDAIHAVREEYTVEDQWLDGSYEE